MNKKKKNSFLLSIFLIRSFPLNEHSSGNGGKVNRYNRTNSISAGFSVPMLAPYNNGVSCSFPFPCISFHPIHPHPPKVCVALVERSVAIHLRYKLGAPCLLRIMYIRAPKLRWKGCIGVAGVVSGVYLYTLKMEEVGAPSFFLKGILRRKGNRAFLPPVLHNKQQKKRSYISASKAINLEKQNFFEKSFYTSYTKLTEIKLITIGLASPERIRRWAEKTLPNGKVIGQVTNANTLHHKTFKPQKGGLFCERIFGPLKDFECACGKTQKPFSVVSNQITNSKENLSVLDPLTKHQDPLASILFDPSSLFISNGKAISQTEQITSYAWSATEAKSKTLTSDVLPQPLPLDPLPLKLTHGLILNAKQSTPLVELVEGVGTPNNNVVNLEGKTQPISLVKSLSNVSKRKYCPTCDVEYTWSIIRRYQLGYIDLVSPVTHVWYLKATPSYLSILLDMKKKHLEQIVYCSETMTLENSVKFFSFFQASLKNNEQYKTVRRKHRWESKIEIKRLNWAAKLAFYKVPQSLCPLLRQNSISDKGPLASETEHQAIIKRSYFCLSFFKKNKSNKKIRATSLFLGKFLKFKNNILILNHFKLFTKTAPFTFLKKKQKSNFTLLRKAKIYFFNDLVRTKPKENFFNFSSLLTKNKKNLSKTLFLTLFLKQKYYKKKSDLKQKKQLKLTYLKKVKLFLGRAWPYVKGKDYRTGWEKSKTASNFEAYKLLHREPSSLLSWKLYSLLRLILILVSFFQQTFNITTKKKEKRLKGHLSVGRSPFIKGKKGIFHMPFICPFSFFGPTNVVSVRSDKKRKVKKKTDLLTNAKSNKKIEERISFNTYNKKTIYGEAMIEDFLISLNKEKKKSIEIGVHKILKKLPIQFYILSSIERITQKKAIFMASQKAWTVLFKKAYKKASFKAATIFKSKLSSKAYFNFTYLKLNRYFFKKTGSKFNYNFSYASLIKLNKFSSNKFLIKFFASFFTLRTQKNFNYTLNFHACFQPSLNILHSSKAGVSGMGKKAMRSMLSLERIHPHSTSTKGVRSKFFLGSLPQEKLKFVFFWNQNKRSLSSKGGWRSLLITNKFSLLLKQNLGFKKVKRLIFFAKFNFKNHLRTYISLLINLFNFSYQSKPEKGRKKINKINPWVNLKVLKFFLGSLPQEKLKFVFFWNQNKRSLSTLEMTFKVGVHSPPSLLRFLSTKGGWKRGLRGERSYPGSATRQYIPFPPYLLRMLHPILTANFNYTNPINVIARGPSPFLLGPQTKRAKPFYKRALPFYKQRCSCAEQAYAGIPKVKERKDEYGRNRQIVMANISLKSLVLSDTTIDVATQLTIEKYAQKMIKGTEGIIKILVKSLTRSIILANFTNKQRLFQLKAKKSTFSGVASSSFLETRTQKKVATLITKPAFMGVRSKFFLGSLPQEKLKFIGVGTPINFSSKNKKTLCKTQPLLITKAPISNSKVKLNYMENQILRKSFFLAQRTAAKKKKINSCTFSEIKKIQLLSTSLASHNNIISSIPHFLSPALAGESKGPDPILSLPPPTNFSYTNPMDAFGGKDVKQSTGSRGPSPIHLWCMPLAYTNLLTHQSIKHAINPGSLKLRLNKYASNSIINNTFFSIKKKQAWQIEPKTLLKKSHIVFFKASFLRTFSTNYAFNLSKLTNQIPFWRSKYRIKTGVLKNKNENKKKFLKPSKFGTASLIMLGAPTPSTKGVSVTKVSSSSRTSNLSSAWSCLFHSHPLFSSKDSKLRLEKATVSYTNRKTSSNSIVFFKPFIALRSAVWPLSISATKINYMIALKKFSYFYGAPKTFKQSLKLFNVIEKSLYGATIALANLRLHSFHVHQRWKGEGPLHQRWKRSSVRLPMDRGLYLQHSSYSSSFPPTLRTHPPKVELVDVLLRKRAGDGWEKNATAPNLEDKNKLLGPNFYIRGPKKTNRKFSRGTLLSNYPQIKFPLSGIQTSLKNNIILEIWTNGSIHPRQALYDACKNLLSIFSKLEKARFTRAIFQSEKTYEKLGFSLISSETTAMAQNPQPWWKSNLIKQSLIKNEWQTSNGSLPFSVVNKLNQTRFLRLWGKTYNNNTYSHSQKMLPSNPLNKRISLGTKQCYAYTSTKGVLRRGVWDGVGECYAPIHPKTKGRVPSTREVNSYSSTPLEIAGYPNVFNKKNTNKEMAFKHNSTVHPSYAHQRWMEGAPTSSIPLTSKVRIKGIFHMPFLKGLRSNPFLTLKLPIPFLATAALIKGVDPKQEEGSSRRKERAEPLINESKFSFVPIWGVMFNKNKQFFLAMPKNHQIAFFQNQTRKKNFLMQSIAIKGCYKNGFYLSKLANTKANAKASFTPVSLNNLAVNTSKSTNALKANQVPLWLEAKMNQVLGASYGAPEKGPLIIENLKKIDVFLKQKQINWNIKMSLTDYNLLKTKPDFVDIGKLNISLRPYTCLKRANINTLGELLKKSKEELLALKNFGKQSLKELEENLKQLGLSLRS